MPRCVFLLSPARCDGRRGAILLGGRGEFPLAVQLRERGAPIGDVFSFLSGLYFRGKLTYSRAFAAPGDILVIAPGRGMISPEEVVTVEDLREIAEIGVTTDEPRFRDPLERDATSLENALSAGDRVVLLGSIATGKYVDIIEGRLNGRLFFPSAFVGRGDMSRGGLLLRCVLDRSELDYVPIAGAVRRGARPPRLEPLR